MSYRASRFPSERSEWTADAGGPASFSALVRVPDRGRVRWAVLDASLDAQAAAKSVAVSEPAVMRDLRVVRVTFTPPDMAPGERCSVYVRLSTVAGPGVNEKTRDLPYLSPAFDRLYRQQVVNYDPGDYRTSPPGARDPVPDGARYLVIAADTYEQDVAPLAEWRHAQGLLTRVVSLSTIGSTSDDIRAYIQTAYDTWDVPPEFVLLVGDTEQLPGRAIQHPILVVYTDNYYATLEGDDVYSDVMIGRITADNHWQCETQVAKILGYERTPVTGDPDWPLSASLLIADDYDSGDWIYYENTWFVYDLMEGASFAPIDTLFDKNGVSRQQVYNSVNDGSGFVNFRGQAWYEWPYPFDLDTQYVTTGWRLPVVLSATCYTGTYDEDNFMCEDWMRAGSATNPKGGVAFFATGTAYPGEPELALRRGYVDEGFFANVFDTDGLTLGEACVAGKNNMMKLTGNSEEYDGWNLLGDPAMRLWSGAMRTLLASHDMAVQPGHTDFTVTVTDGRGYVEGALVACVKGEESYSWGYTNSLGEATLSVDPTTEGTMTVTASARNAVPYEAVVDVVTGPHPVLSQFDIDDTSGGNGDGYLSPGETVTLATELVNAGDETATGVQAVLRTTDSYVTVTDSVSNYQDIPPGAAFWSDDAFEIEVSQDCPTGHRIHYTLHVTHTGTGNALAPDPIIVETGVVSDAGTVVDDPAPGGNGDGALSPNETVGLAVTIMNDGPCALSSVQGTLTTDDPSVAVTMSTSIFGELGPGGSADNSAFPFVLSVSPSASDGHVVELSLAVTGDGGHYTYCDTLGLAFELQGGATMLPSGPDDYGYYVYDQTDGLFGPAPAYDWFDIAPPGPGSLMTEITDEDAQTATFSTLWNVDYYGQTFNQISVNSNGFLSLGWTDYRLGDNSQIPDSHGPQNMVAAFWDDLDPSAGGDIYKYLDSANHRWIIQFDNVRHWGMSHEETFQVIFRHPTYYPTPTGDGEILIQYEEISLPGACTIGFENEAQDDGIECLYDGAYHPQIAPIDSGSALLLTTVPPSAGGLPWLVLSDVILDDAAAGNGNGRAEPGETVSLAVELTNEGGLPAEGVSLTLSSTDGLTAISDPAGSTPDIPSGASADNSADPFTLTVSESLGDTVATLWAAVEANGGDTQGAQRVELHIDLSGTSVADEPPAVFRFRHARPNPFRSETVFALALPNAGDASVRVYDVTGRLVRTLVDSRLPAGELRVAWDGRDESGARCASGVYFAKVETESRTATRKAVLLR
ncbi:MAG: T9SS type A sorting domain-containing protein [Candidatus Eisenbacteria bacterium]|nr:T9SS type A sorting domain-containing protein [Candidatus Eisenbacteria bacterium]